METVKLPQQHDPANQTPRVCHFGDQTTGRTYCGIVVEPYPHTSEECDEQGHGQCVVCFSLAGKGLL